MGFMWVEGQVKKMGENKDTERILTIVNNTDAQISANIEESYIFTTEDKVRILYDEYNAIRKLSSDTMSWLGIFLALLIADLTCSFKTIWILNSSIIQAVFIVSTVVFFVLLVRSFLSWMRNRGKLKFSFFIEQLKGEERTKEDSK